MADAFARRGSKCPKGHSMDPNWEQCPYCEAEQNSNQKSVGVSAVESSDRQRTRVDSFVAAAPAPDRKTRTMAVSSSSGGQVANDTRRVVGVLVSYTWHAAGELYPIRAGRNFIGRGQTSSEAQPRACDIQVPHDSEMSEEHALILCRQGGYELLDQTSTNGTFLNDQPLKANLGTDLPNYATIKTGSTLWTFIRIEVPESAADAPQVNREAAPKPSPKKDRGDTNVG